MEETKKQKVRFEIKDWLFNAGMVGLYRIMTQAGHQPTVKENYIECDISFFENFEKKYFEYFFNTYEKHGLWYKLTQYCKGMPHSSENDEMKIEKFIKLFGPDLVKPASMYCTAYGMILGDKDYARARLKLIKDKKSPVSLKLEKIDEIYRLFRDNKDIIEGKHVIYTIINKYWSGVSFLNSKQSRDNMFDLYKQDFVAGFVSFQEPTTNKIKYRCLTCNAGIDSQKNASKGLSWLGMDLDPGKKTSVYWGHKPDIIICPTCRLVYSCVPAGFVTHNFKGIFINDNRNVGGLIGINGATELRFSEVERMEELENLTYGVIVNMIRQVREKESKEEIDNIQIVKYDGNTGYSFNLLSKHILQIIDASSNQLDHLAKMKDVYLDSKNHFNLYSEVIDCLYRNVSLYPLIALMLRMAFKNTRDRRLHYAAGLLFDITMNYIGGFMSDKKKHAVRYMGLDLKKGYIDRNAKNKISGIAYRLLNNLKTKNTNGFLDVIINCHMYLGKEVPSVFVECIDDVERFQAYGYAFLLGFTGEKYEKNSKDNAESTKGGNDNEK
ncbi:MAG: type I-B CRISPR-associated protein Cas8b1/Cst1 [bacterium]|nr:type I-B CRISPR-associated protein Cas8b1/Cst1 [bacterium]